MASCLRYRFHGRLTLEMPLRELPHAQLVLAALCGLQGPHPDPDPDPAAQALAEFFDQLGLADLRDRDRWRQSPRRSSA